MCCLSAHRGGAPCSCPKEGNGAHFTRHSVPAKHRCQHFIRTSHGLNNDPPKETLLYPILQLRKQRIREVHGLAQSHTASQCGFPHAELEYKKGLFDPLHSPFCSSQDTPPQCSNWSQNTWRPLQHKHISHSTRGSLTIHRTASRSTDFPYIDRKSTRLNSSH